MEAGVRGREMVGGVSTKDLSGRRSAESQPEDAASGVFHAVGGGGGGEGEGEGGGPRWIWITKNLRKQKQMLAF